MNQRTMSRILVAGMLFALVMIAANAWAQATARPAAPSATSQVPSKEGTSAKAHEPPKNPACRQIYDECQKLGFIVGEWRQDNGLWKDCFDPVVNGGKATRDGKPIQVPVSPSVVQQCREHREHKGAKGMKQGGQQTKPAPQ
jgi:hypothetical protein